MDADQQQYKCIESVNVGGDEICFRRPAEPQPPNTLLLPERYDSETGTFYTMYHDINGSRRPALVQLCKAYQLSSYEKMDVLRERLAGFSEHVIRWKTLIPGAKRSHRGVRDGKITKNHSSTKDNKQGNKSKPKKSKEKLSTLRRNDLMGITSSSTSLGQTTMVVRRSKDLRTLEEKNDLVKWAKEYIQTHPYIPPDELARRAQARAEAKAQASDTAVISDHFQATNRKIDDLTSIVGALVQSWPSYAPSLPIPVLPQLLSASSPPALPVSAASRDALDSSPPCFTPSTPALLRNNSHRLTSLPTSSISTTLSSNALLDNIFSSAAHTSPVDQIRDLSNPTSPSEGDETFVLKIADGKTVTFKQSDVRAPNQVSFATNISRLDRVWDDESPNWDPVDCGTRLLSINGVPIALRYWRNVYGGKKDKRWRGIKGIWTEWKFIIEQYRLSTPEVFWDRFTSATGERYNWKAICDALREERAIHNKELADTAKLEYGDNFHKFFSNRGKVMVDVSAIAHRYLALKNTMEVD
ncbi:hypothetical protein DFJ43DRAFT_361546 [Lentinula guzmanii]|uniref:Uncharacterized protein n=1 Tax=Lentinula guzmanii TaxID=2804957 RepID=A0AA38J8Z4_9AGAR|nr:hypothetical protein DFJ43DRAFT_361546 [Lentinula guzmanii]